MTATTMPKAYLGQDTVPKIRSIISLTSYCSFPTFQRLSAPFEHFLILRFTESRKKCDSMQNAALDPVSIDWFTLHYLRYKEQRS